MINETDLNAIRAHLLKFQESESTLQVPVSPANKMTIDRILQDDVAAYINSDIKKALTNYVNILPELKKRMILNPFLNKQIYDSAFSKLSQEVDFEIITLLS
jgi:RNA polymerase-interacting CarD/CdnL/TRCF family regulator